MKFNFQQSTTWEVNEKEILYDLIEIKNFINERLVDDFGCSVEKFDLGYEIYNFQGQIRPHVETANLRRWSPKQKSILVVKQFDFNELRKFSAEKQFFILKNKILEAIEDFKEFKRKPKDFNYLLFFLKMNEILSEYEKVFISSKSSSN